MKPQQPQQRSYRKMNKSIKTKYIIPITNLLLRKVTGLSLSMYYSAVKKLEGLIKVNSVCDKGTTAIISLPVH